MKPELADCMLDTALQDEFLSLAQSNAILADGETFDNIVGRIDSFPGKEYKVEFCK